MPLTMLGSAVFVLASMIRCPLSLILRISGDSLQGGKRRLNAEPLVFGNQAGKDLPEVRVLGARVDVLPAIGLEECSLDRSLLGVVDRAVAICHEVVCVGRSLGL